MEYSLEWSQMLDWINYQNPNAWLGLLLTLSGVGLLLIALRRSAGGKSLKQAASTSRSATKANPKGLSKDEELAELRLHLDRQNTAMGLLGERILALEEYIEMLGNRQQVQNSNKRDKQFYRQAINLVDQGVSTDELAQQCGISASEADLIAALYRKAG